MKTQHDKFHLATGSGHRLTTGSFKNTRLAAAVVLAAVSAAPLPAGVLFHEDFESPNVAAYEQGMTPDAWVPADQGYNSGFHGLTDQAGGDFSAPSGNNQAYAFRYTNTGITTAEGMMGPPLAVGGGYEVSFDVVRDDGGNAGTPYTVQLLAFGAGAARDDCRSTPAASTVLASTTGNAPSDGSIATRSFTFTPDAVTHAAEIGMDLGIRIKGSSTSAIIDNIAFRAIAGPGPGLGLVTTDPLDDATRALISRPLRALFSKEITAGSGNITLRNLTDTIDTVIRVGDPRIAISGTCLDIEPGAPFIWGRNYAVLIDSGAIVEKPGGTPFAGIAAETTWNFSTAAGDPLFYSIARLKDHINGLITLTPDEIEAFKLDLDSVKGRFAESAQSITALLDLVTTYDTVEGPLWGARGLPRRDSVTNDLHWTLFNVMQNIMDRIYTDGTLAAHEALLDGFKFGSSANFPGACDPPADPDNSHTAIISARYLDTYGPATLGDGPNTFARKPTGTYLAPGTIATVTVPPELVGRGYKIRVGCHSWDFSNKPDIKRLDRVTRVYEINALQTRVANPLGGGIYLEVPFLADSGVVNINITGAVRAPYFSAKGIHRTTAAEWLQQRANPAPWADFQSDKFMMQVPKNWVYAMPDPTQLMEDWDAAMDAINDLMGYPRIRGKETMYPQVDILNRASVYAPGYPSVNTKDNPNKDGYGGYRNHHLVRGPQFAPDYEFHEQGHGYLFPKFGGETESAVNLLHVAVWNRKFGYSLDEAFRKSRGYNRSYMTLDTTAMAWMCVFNFSPREVPMATAEKAYQLKGHAKFVDIARLYGWGVLNDFWKSMVDDEENGISYSTDTDSLLLRLCKSAGKDIRPLFHFWGIHPQNPGALAAAIAGEGIPADPAIRDRLLYYKTLVPANNADFRTFALGWWGKPPSIGGAWEEREHSRQWDETPLYGAGDQQRSQGTNPGEIYNENSAADITSRVQELVDLYFPGTIHPDPMGFASAPAAVNATTIGMTAATATAATGPIEYYFENTTNGTFRGWSTDPKWNNTGLTTSVTYSFRVKARDGETVPNETAWSDPALANITDTTDTTAPRILSLKPLNGGPLVPVTSDLVVTFTEPVVAGSGFITIRNLTDGTQSQIDIDDPAQVSISGTVLTINPAADLVGNRNYAIRIDATAIKDLANNRLDGIADDTTWNFTTATPPPAGFLFDEDFETPDVTAYDQNPPNPTGWVAANQGYNANKHGLTDKAGGDFSAADPNHQAYAFRYTNAGLTTEEGVIGSLAADTTYTVSFDVVKDSGAGATGTPYQLQLIAFAAGAARDDCRSTPADSTVLVTSAGDAPGDGSFTTISFDFTPDPGADAAQLGKDLGIRLIGATNSAIIDNVRVTAVGPGNTFADWIGGYPGLNGLTGFSDDADGDGIDNGLENFFGTAPDVGNAGLIAGTRSGNSFTFTHPQNATPADDVSIPAYGWSTDLRTFHASGATESGTTVDLVAVPNTPTAGTTTITATITGTIPARLFVKLGVARQ